MFSHLTNNAITSKQIRMADDKSFDKIPGNMWYLSQMKQFLNHKFAKAEPVVQKETISDPTRESTTGGDMTPSSPSDEE